MMDKLRLVGGALLIVTGLNVGVDATAGIDLVGKAIGSFDPAETVFYGLVGVSALEAAYRFIQDLRS